MIVPEYHFVEKPFLIHLEVLGWDVTDKSEYSWARLVSSKLICYD